MTPPKESLSPETRSTLDAAFAAHQNKIASAANAEQEQIDRMQVNLNKMGQELEQVVRPILNKFVDYLQGKNIAANISHLDGLKTGGLPSLLELRWGRIVRTNGVAGRPDSESSQNAIKFSARASTDKNLVVSTALAGQKFIALPKTPDPITTAWIETVVTEFIKNTLDIRS